MAKLHEHGDLIVLVWDTTPEYEVFRGHVALEETTEALRAYGYPPATRVEHRYGRWSQENNSEHIMVLRDYFSRGRGRFPITLCYWDAEKVK